MVAHAEQAHDLVTPSRAVGDDGLQACVFGRDLDQGVGASREAESADPLGIDVRTLAQERKCAGDVLRPAPAEPDRAAFALAAAAGVVDEDAEAVAGEEFRVRDRPGPVASSSVDDDDRRTCDWLRPLPPGMAGLASV